MCHRGTTVIHQPALEAVLQAGKHTVVTAVTQDKSLVFRKLAIREQFGRESLFPVQALGPELEALLRHIQGEVTHRGEGSTLADQLVSGVVVYLQVAFEILSGVFHLTVNRVLEREFFLVDVFPDGQHTVFRIIQVTRLCHNAGNGQGVELVDQVCSGDHVAGAFVAGSVSPGPQHGNIVDLQPFARVIRDGVLGRRRTVLRIENLGAFRNIDFHVNGGIILPRFHSKGRLFGIAGKSVSVLLQRRWRVIIKKPCHSGGAAVGYIRSHFRKIYLVQHSACRICQGYGFHFQLSDLEGGMRLLIGVFIIRAVAHDHLVFSRADGSPGRKLPLSSVIQPVA